MLPLCWVKWREVVPLGYVEFGLAAVSGSVGSGSAASYGYVLPLCWVGTSVAAVLGQVA